MKNNDDYYNVPEVKFSEVKDVLDEFIHSLQEHDDEKIAYFEKKFMDVVYGFIRFFVRRKYPKNHSSRSSLGSTSLTHRIFDYIYFEDRIPKYMNNIRNKPDSDSAEDCLRFLWDAIAKKTRFIPINEYNRKKKEKSFPNHEDFEAITNEGNNSTFENVVTNEKNQALYDALAELPEDQQEIINLVDLQGLTLRDAARIIQIDESTLRYKRNKINKEIRIKLKNKGFKYF